MYNYVLINCYKFLDFLSSTNLLVRSNLVTDVLVLGNRIFRHIKMTKVLSSLSKPRVTSVPMLILAIHWQANDTELDTSVQKK